MKTHEGCRISGRVTDSEIPLPSSFLYLFDCAKMEASLLGLYGFSCKRGLLLLLAYVFGHVAVCACECVLPLGVYMLMCAVADSVFVLVR